MVTSSDIFCRVSDCGGAKKWRALHATRLHLLGWRFLSYSRGIFSPFVGLATSPRIVIGSPIVGRDKGVQIMENPSIRAHWQFVSIGLNFP